MMKYDYKHDPMYKINSTMRIVILAGGLGTRISEETELRPKPMVQIGDKPILHHLMSSFSMQGYSEFVIALGYKSLYIKNWFKELCELHGDLFVDLNNKSITQRGELENLNWKIDLVETGLHTQTGGRVRRILANNPGESFLITYGDGLSNINVPALISFHNKSEVMATITAVHPPGRFGSLTIAGNQVTQFEEKNDYSDSWINGGWIIVEPEVINFIHSDSESFEFDVLPRLAASGELNAYKHTGFWHAMDTLRDKKTLSELAELPNPPWFL